MRNFNPMDHYWLRQNGTVYSSSAQADLPVKAPAYRAFLDFGGYATRYPQDANGVESPEELTSMLANYGLEAYASLDAVAPKVVQTATAQAVNTVCEAAISLPVAPVANEAPCFTAAAAYSEQHAEPEARSAYPAPDSSPAAAADAAPKASAEAAPAPAVSAAVYAPVPGRLAAAPRIAVEKDVPAQRVQAKVALYKQVSDVLLGQQQAIIDTAQNIIRDKCLTDAEKIEALEHLHATFRPAGTSKE